MAKSLVKLDLLEEKKKEETLTEITRAELKSNT